MRVHTNQLAIRVLGTLTGTGFLGVGGYAIFGADAGVAEALREGDLDLHPPGERVGVHRERALWFGITAGLGGVWAIAVSWLDSDLNGVWCRSPRARRRASGDS